MLLLLDIGNTNSHLGLATGRRVLRKCDIPTAHWQKDSARQALIKFIAGSKVRGVAICSVVPQTTPRAKRTIRKLCNVEPLELTCDTLRGLTLDYPKPATIGRDRLANALAAKTRFGSPVIVVAFGTATTLDVIDSRGHFLGGVIAPGLASMTEYLHEKTALLPRIRIRPVANPIGKSTEQALLAGTVYGYRGLIREIINGQKKALRSRRVPVIATGGYARLMAAQLPEISVVEPKLTLEGLRISWVAHYGDGVPDKSRAPRI